MKHAESNAVSRRRLLAMASLSAGGALLAQRPLFADRGRVAPATANPTANPKNTSFASLKQIDAGLLNVGYAEAGLTTFTAMSMVRRCWQRRATGLSSPFCGGSARRAFVPAKPFGMDNSRWLLSTSSR